MTTVLPTDKNAFHTRYSTYLYATQYKVKPVTKIADLRPISVTPVFSRITERLVMRKHLLTYLSFQMKICEISLRTNCQAAQHLLWFL